MPHCLRIHAIMLKEGCNNIVNMDTVYILMCTVRSNWYTLNKSCSS